MNEARQRHGLSMDDYALLDVDQHSSRLNPAALNALVENNIRCVTKASHSSYITQMMDVGPYGVYKKKLQKYMRENRKKMNEKHLIKLLL